MASLKTEVDKLDIDKLAPVPVDSRKLSDVVKTDVVKKTVYNKLAVKVNNDDTSDLVLKTKYQTDKTIRKKNSWCSWSCYENKCHWITKQNSRC